MYRDRASLKVRLAITTLGTRIAIADRIAGGSMMALPLMDSQGEPWRAVDNRRSLWFYGTSPGRLWFYGTGPSRLCSMGQVPVACGSIGQVPIVCGSMGQVPVACGSIGQVPIVCGSIGQVPVACGSMGQVPIVCGSIGQVPVACGSMGQVPIVRLYPLTSRCSFHLYYKYKKIPRIRLAEAINARLLVHFAVFSCGGLSMQDILPTSPTLVSISPVMSLIRTASLTA
ncbi:putative sodium-coupled neutral amino acid transporter 10 isoform X3 [Venturia nashicola]|nr:putative sodium-coupled neutral amino acid transporter 10 isoform X3 [Venturia nashicola]